MNIQAQETLPIETQCRERSAATAGSAPGVPNLKLKAGSAMFLPHSDQVIFYDHLGGHLFGWDWTRKYMWVVTGDTVPPKELCDQMLAEYLEAQNAKLTPLPPGATVGGTETL